MVPKHRHQYLGHLSPEQQREHERERERDLPGFRNISGTSTIDAPPDPPPVAHPEHEYQRELEGTPLQRLNMMGYHQQEGPPPGHFQDGRRDGVPMMAGFRAQGNGG